MVAIQNTVSQIDTAGATASLGFIRSVAMALSVVVGDLVFQNSMDTRQSSLAAAGLSCCTLRMFFSDGSIATGRCLYIHSSVPTSLSVSQYFQVSDITSRLVMSLSTAIV
jgi:hypothetical protein